MEVECPYCDRPENTTISCYFCRKGNCIVLLIPHFHVFEQKQRIELESHSRSHIPILRIPCPIHCQLLTNLHDLSLSTTVPLLPPSLPTPSPPPSSISPSLSPASHHPLHLPHLPPSLNISTKPSSLSPTHATSSRTCYPLIHRLTPPLNA